jgi:hypothetical protein
MMEERQERHHARMPEYAPGNEVLTKLLYIVSAIVLGTVGYGVWLIRAYVPILGYVALGAAGILLLCGVAIPVIFTIRYAMKADWHDIAPEGSVVRSLFGKSTLFAPMTATTATMKQRGRKVVVTPVVPTIIELIEAGVIAMGQLMMHMGFEETKGGLVPVIDSWPGTFVVAGKGRSGKTRRVLTIIFQALIGRARVFVCDPHHIKDDSLTNLIAALAPWITIARGNAEIIEVSRYFLNEMENRVQELSMDRTPWLIIFDEWSRLMTTDKINDDDKETMKTCVLECSRQYAGFYGFAGIIGQTWTEESAGGTDIRRSMHKAFIHQLNAEYAKFFLKGKWMNKAEDLTTRQCLYRQDGQVRQIITHTVPDSAAEWFADWLMEHMPPEQLAGPKPQPRIGDNTQKTKQIAGPKPQDRNTGPLGGQRARYPWEEQTMPMDAIAMNASSSSTNDVVHAQNPVVGAFTVNAENDVNVPVQPDEGTSTQDAKNEAVSMLVNASSAPAPAPVNFSEEDATAIIHASILLTHQHGSVTRRAIMEHLGWTRAQWPTIKAVCDKYGIAKQ